MTAAPRATPDHPKNPNWPVLGGMNGCQLALARLGCRITNIPAIPMNTKTMATLTITMAELKLADSLMPKTSTQVTKAIARNATTLNTPVACDNDAGSTFPVCRAIPSVVRAAQWPL